MSLRASGEMTIMKPLVGTTVFFFLGAIASWVICFFVLPLPWETSYLIIDLFLAFSAIIYSAYFCRTTFAQ
jgi:hypothetical protein